MTPTNDLSPDAATSLADALASGAAADIWYDAADHGDDGPAETIEATKAAMIEAAEHLRGNAPLHNALQVEAALCIWEELLARHNQADGEPWAAPMNALWEAVGTGQMRNLVARVAPAVEAFYTELFAKHGDALRLHAFPSYDWDFIPAVCAGLDWSGDMTTACYMPHAIALPDTMAAHIDFAIWREAATRAAGRIWGYPGLVDDDPETTRRGFDSGDDPAAFIKSLGEELDLAEPDPMTAADLAKQYPA